MTARIRLALLLLVLTAFVAGHAGAAVAKPQPAPHSYASIVAREQAQVVRYARHLVGVPYTYGGSSPSSGFDCSGFTRFVYSHFGIDLPHYSGAQFGEGHSVSRWALRPATSSSSTGSATSASTSAADGSSTPRTPART